MKASKGSSLLEILIVIAIVGFFLGVDWKDVLNCGKTKIEEVQYEQPLKHKQSSDDGYTVE